jgi:L-asparaginase
MSKNFRVPTMSLRIIATGGTFDKHYDPLTGNLFFQQSVLPAALRRARIAPQAEQDCVFEALLALDSLDMQDEHRDRIKQACLQSAQKRIVVVHGTDTMRETAAALAAAQLDKTIVLTGAMVPYLIDDSDAFFNLGFACAAAQLAQPGVYIAMNGQLFDWDNVQKNREQGCFETRR